MSTDFFTVLGFILTVLTTAFVSTSFMIILEIKNNQTTGQTYGRKMLDELKVGVDLIKEKLGIQEKKETNHCDHEIGKDEHCGKYVKVKQVLERLSTLEKENSELWAAINRSREQVEKAFSERLEKLSAENGRLWGAVRGNELEFDFADHTRRLDIQRDHMDKLQDRIDKCESISKETNNHKWISSLEENIEKLNQIKASRSDMREIQERLENIENRGISKDGSVINDLLARLVKIENHGIFKECSIGNRTCVGQCTDFQREMFDLKNSVTYLYSKMKDQQEQKLIQFCGCLTPCPKDVRCDSPKNMFDRLCKLEETVFRVQGEINKLGAMGKQDSGIVENLKARMEAVENKPGCFHIPYVVSNSEVVQNLKARMEAVEKSCLDNAEQNKRYQEVMSGSENCVGIVQQIVKQVATLEQESKEHQNALNNHWDRMDNHMEASHETRKQITDLEKKSEENYKKFGKQVEVLSVEHRVAAVSWRELMDRAQVLETRVPNLENKVENHYNGNIASIRVLEKKVHALEENSFVSVEETPKMDINKVKGYLDAWKGILNQPMEAAEEMKV